MSLYDREYGDQEGPLMMFIHGGGVSGWMWEKQIQYFKGYHCIVPDLPGHGESMEIPFSIKDSAERLMTLIEEKSEGKQVIVIGFSLGAQVALQMLSLKPDVIDYAVINSAAVKGIPFSWLIPFSVKITFPFIKNRTFSKLQAKSLYLDPSYFEKYYEETSRMKQETLIQVLEENMSFRIPEQFNKVKAKMLVTVGEKEKDIMKQSAMDLVKSHPHCQGIILPDVGHGVSLARPDFFNELIERWLKTGKY